MVRPTKVLLIVGGGPAACRTPELVHQLRRRGCAVRVLFGTDAAPYVAEEAILVEQDAAPRVVPVSARAHDAQDPRLAPPP